MPELEDRGFEIAIAHNFRVKAIIVGIAFSIIILIQVVGIFLVGKFHFIEDELLTETWVAPLLISVLVVDQFFGYRHFTKIIKEGKRLKKWIIYVSGILESSMPTIVLAYAIVTLSPSKHIDANMLLNSPPMIVYVFFIILSSLFLDFKLCVLTGLSIALQYLFLCYYFLDFGTDIDHSFATTSKSIFFFGAGIIAGVVARVIKNTTMESLESKNALINKLDELVKERTEELHQANEELNDANEELNQINEEILAQRDKIESQKNLIEEKHMEIHSSIVYGKRIQNALLDNGDWDNIGSDRFLLYMPKDIVSGDFYWSHIDEDLQIWAAADCTGHGIPGAFMSMLGIGFLNDIVVEEGEKQPDRILNKLRDKIITALKQHHKSDFEQKDGMDIALCVYDKSKKILKFSGANNPMIIIRDGEIMTFKSDRMPVGKHFGKEHPFSTTEVKVKEGDIVYTFSDGYADEFGGEKMKKLGAKGFRNLLLELNSLSMEKQRDKLEQFMDNWIAHTHQIDDIVVLGVKI